MDTSLLILRKIYPSSKLITFLFLSYYARSEIFFLSIIVLIIIVIPIVIRRTIS